MQIDFRRYVPTQRKVAIAETDIEPDKEQTENCRGLYQAKQKKRIEEDHAK